jgi:hypothetical protein
LKAEAECLELGSGWDLFVLRFILRCLKFEAPEWINALATTGGQMAQWLGVFRPVLVQERGATQVETELKNCITTYNTI